MDARVFDAYINTSALETSYGDNGGSFYRDVANAHDAYSAAPQIPPHNLDIKPFISGLYSPDASFRSPTPPALHNHHHEPFQPPETYNFDPDRLGYAEPFQRPWSPVSMLDDSQDSDSVFSMNSYINIYTTETTTDTYTAGVSPNLLTYSRLQSPSWPSDVARDVPVEMQLDDPSLLAPYVRNSHPSPIHRAPRPEWHNDNSPDDPLPSTSRSERFHAMDIDSTDGEYEHPHPLNSARKDPLDVPLYRPVSPSKIRPMIVQRRTTSTVVHDTFESTSYAIPLERSRLAPPSEFGNFESPESVQTGYGGSTATKAIPRTVVYTDDAGSKETQFLRRHCFNCQTIDPPSWRRSTVKPGKIVCNKCGLYEKTHKRPRPSHFDGMPGGLTAARTRKTSKTSDDGDSSQRQETKGKKKSRNVPRMPSTASFTSTSSENWDGGSYSSDPSSPISYTPSHSLPTNVRTRPPVPAHVGHPSLFPSNGY